MKKISRVTFYLVSMAKRDTILKKPERQTEQKRFILNNRTVRV